MLGFSYLTHALSVVVCWWWLSFCSCFCGFLCMRHSYWNLPVKQSCAKIVCSIHSDVNNITSLLKQEIHCVRKKVTPRHCTIKTSYLNKSEYNFAHFISNKLLKRTPNFVKKKIVFLIGVMNCWILITKYFCYQYGVAQVNPSVNVHLRNSKNNTWFW